jgi:hypothetical protein
MGCIRADRVCWNGNRDRQYHRVHREADQLPPSRAYGKGHDSLYGLVSGMVVMALSLLLMR